MPTTSPLKSDNPPPRSQCLASVAAKGGAPYPVDTAAYTTVNGLYQRPETSIALVGTNDGKANSYSDPFYGSLGGKYLLFYNSSHVTLTGRGYVLVRWEYAYFNRGGLMNAANGPTIVASAGSTIKKVAIAGRYMLDFDMDGIPGTSGVWRPGTTFTPITISGLDVTSGWQDEYYYLDGEATFANHENGLDYNLGITPVAFEDVRKDLANTVVGSGQVVSRSAISLDPYAGDTPPSSPTQLTATVISDSRVDLTWSNCAASARGYLVEYSYAGTFGDAGKMQSYAVGDLYTNGGSLPAGATSYSLAKLSPSTTYNVRVKAYDPAGDSAYSNVVQITTPAAGSLASPWQEVDVFPSGTPPTVAGSSSTVAGNVALRIASGDIWNRDDSLHFVYRPMTGDGTIVARVVGVAYTNVSAKSGLMIRDGLYSNAIYTMATLSPKGVVGMQYRGSIGGTTANAGGLTITPFTPWWLRVRRTGNVFTTEASPDGQTWTVMGTRTITMGATVSVGLATASLSTRPTVATFDQVSIQQ